MVNITHSHITWNAKCASETENMERKYAWRWRRVHSYAGAELEGAADGDGGGEKDHPQRACCVGPPLLAPAVGRRRLLRAAPDLIVVLLAAVAEEKRLRRRRRRGGPDHSGLHIVRGPHYAHCSRVPCCYRREMI